MTQSTMTTQDGTVLATYAWQPENKEIKPAWSSFTVRSGIHPKDITGDVEQAEEYHKDNLCHGFNSAQTGVDCHTCAEEILQKSFAKAEELLLMHGTEDFICSVEGSRSMARGAVSGFTYSEWEGCRHELHHDKDRIAVRDAMASWILKRG